MPYKCCVPDCTSNFRNTEYTTVFRFPTVEKHLKLWMEKIPRRNWEPNSNTRICVNHFEEQFVSFEEKFIDADGNIKHYKRKRPILRKDAVPTIFPDSSSNLPSKSSSTNTASKKKGRIKKERREEIIQNFFLSDVITDFRQLCENYREYTNGIKWKVEILDEEFIAYIIDFQLPCPKITTCVKISQDLALTVFKNDLLVSSETLTWIVGVNIDEELRISLWSQYENLLDYLHAEDNDVLDV